MPAPIAPRRPPPRNHGAAPTRPRRDLILIHVDALVRPIRLGARRRRLRLRQVALRRSAAGRRRHHRQSGVGRGARRRRRALGRAMSRRSCAASRTFAAPCASSPSLIDDGRRRGRALASSSASSSSGLATPAADCTPADRATSRSRSISVCICGAAFPRCSARSRRLVDAFAHQAEAAGAAVMPSYTHLRRAQPVLVAHVWLSHAAAFRRDVDRFDGARHEADVMPLGSGAIAGTALRHRRPGARRPARLHARVIEQHRHVGRSRLRRDVSLRVRDDDGAPQPAGRGRDSLLERGIRFLRDSRLGRHRLEPDAAEEESGPAGARPRQVGPGRRPAHRLADDDEGPAARVQQGSAGGQGDRLRGRGHRSTACARTTATVIRTLVLRPTCHARGGVRSSARDRSRRLPRRARPAVPNGARSDGSHRARPLRGRQGLLLARRSTTGGNITRSSTPMC